ncbi:MAG: DNA translocase FtsK 4TM domain-containing protein, partial [Clostridia bacterium]
VLPFYLLLLAYAFFRKKNPEFRFPRYLIFSTLLFVVFPTFFCIDQNLVPFGDFIKTAAGGEGGGVFGGIFAYGMLVLFTEPVSVVLLVLLGVFSVLMLTNFSWKAYLARKKDELSEKWAAKKEAKELAALETQEEEEEENTIFDEPEYDAPRVEPKRKKGKPKKEPVPGKKRRKVVEYAGNDRVISGVLHNFSSFFTGHRFPAKIIRRCHFVST